MKTENSFSYLFQIKPHFEQYQVMKKCEEIYDMMDEH